MNDKPTPEWIAAALLAVSVLLSITAQSQPKTRASDMREFTVAFWQTMPEVSPLCRTIVDELMYAVAGQLRTWEADAYNVVVSRTKEILISEPVTTNREVISQLEWLECRDLMLWGTDNRQPTPQEATGLRAREERKAQAERDWAAYKAEQKRKMEEFQEELRQRASEGQRIIDQCRAIGGTWIRSHVVGRSRCETPADAERRFQELQESHDRLAKKNCLSEAGATWDPSNKSRGPCITPKEKRIDEWHRQQAEKAERVKREREQAKAEKRRKLEERRRQLSGE